MPRPLPRRTIYRMQVSGLPETSWQVSSVLFAFSGLTGLSHWTISYGIKYFVLFSCSISYSLYPTWVHKDLSYSHLEAIALDF